MIFIDGDKLPTINGTGTEDYYNGAWDFNGIPLPICTTARPSSPARSGSAHATAFTAGTRKADYV